MRLRLDLAYDGTHFSGWAVQPDLRTVQGVLTESLATVLRGPRAALTCAGRTDAGVHARGQVAHVDVDADAWTAFVRATPRGSRRPVDDRPSRVLQRRLNGILPDDVHVSECNEAPPGFDARFSASWRRYAYRIADSDAALDPLLRAHVVAWPRRLDIDAMNEASDVLLGLHDFAAFCRRRAGATTIRTLLDYSWTRNSEHGLVTAAVRADAFCHTMVRSLVGCVTAVGVGRRPVDWPAEVLRSRRRDHAVTVAPARGLVLEEVAYPSDSKLAERAAQARAMRTLVVEHACG